MSILQTISDPMTSTPQPRFATNGYGQYYKYVDTNAAYGQGLTIYTIAPENLNYFIDVAGSGLEPITSDDVVNAQTNSKGGTASVKRYPNDPEPFTRANTARVIMKNRNVRHGSALPGRRFVLTDDTESRQFTYQGSLTALHALLVGNLKMEVKFTHYNGSSEIIKPAVAEG